MTLTLERLESIIQSGDFINLLGESESGIFDCKSEIYTLTDELSKYELAKDVSSFANANGGYILVGVKTTKSEKGIVMRLQKFGHSIRNYAILTNI
jgi:predicted HTH transcriptional regulator